jgi:hypothetical protein
VSPGKTVAYCMIGIAVSGVSITSLANDLPYYFGDVEGANAPTPQALPDPTAEPTSVATDLVTRPPPDTSPPPAGQQEPPESDLSVPLAQGPLPPTQPPEPPPAEPPAANTEPPPSCVDISYLRLQEHAALAVADIVSATGFRGTIYGRGKRPDNPNSDHPQGLAADFSTSDLRVGNEIRDYAEANETRLAIKYTLWQVEEHYDHVHISFLNNPGPNFAPRCG